MSKPSCSSGLSRPGLAQIIGHHAAAGGKAGLHVRRHAQPALDRLLGQQSGGQHHVGIAGIGATGDGGDHHGAVADGARARAGRSPRRCAQVPLLREPKPRWPGGACNACWNVRFTSRQRHAVLRTLWAGQAGLDRAQIESQDFAVLRRWLGVAAEQLLLLGITLDQFAPRRRCGRSGGDRRASARRWGRSPPWRRIRGPCWPPVRDRRRSCARWPGRNIRRTCPPRPPCAGFA